MGVSSCEPSDARHRPWPGGRDDQPSARTRPRQIRQSGRSGIARRFLSAALFVLLASGQAFAQGKPDDLVRIATYAAALSRDGPGLLLRDILRGDDDQIAATISVLIEVSADIVVLTAMDWDADNAALTAFAAALREDGLDYPYQYAGAGNAGLETGFDLDGNGRSGEPRDAQGFGWFTGQSGLAVLSRYPICAVQDLSHLIWAQIPGARLPRWPDGSAFPSTEAQEVQRLSSTSHWIVSVLVDGVRVDLLAWSATPPVFDGPEDRNGLRARDELRLWGHVMDGKVGSLADRFVLIGNSNLDPADGDGDHAAMQGVLDDPRLIDPAPASVGGSEAADPDHRGDPALDTADWPDGAPGNLRVSYVLPSTNLEAAGAGVFWPARDAPERALLGDDGLAAGPHRMVWVDLRTQHAAGQDSIEGCGPEIREQSVEFR